MDKDQLKKLLDEIEVDKKAEAEKKSKVEADLKTVADAITDKIVKAITDIKGGNEGDKKDLKEKLFNFDNGFKAIKYPERLDNLTDEQKIVTFFKSFVMKDLDEESNKIFKALVEGTSADGGYLVPAPLATEVWRILPDYAIMRRIGRTIPMTSRTLALNSLTARPYAYWTSEYASKATTSADFNQVSLTANKLVCLLPVTHELLADANINLANFVIELFAEAIGTEEDDKFFTGSGTGQPRGITAETLTTVNAANSLSFDHLIAIIDSVPQRVTQSPRAAFVSHRYAKRLARQLKDTTNNYLWRDSSVGRMSGQTERLPDTLYGYPYYEQNSLPQNRIYFGDWSFYIIGDRQQITVSSTNEGGDAWRRDATEFKAVERVDGRAVLTTPFAYIDNVK
jgi:HK97 family phage major capsid protein